MIRRFNYSKVSFNAGLLVKEMTKREIKVKLIGDTEVIKAQYKKHKELLYDIHSSPLSYPLGWIVNDKFFTKQWLQKYKIPTAPGYFFTINDVNSALKYAQKLGFPVILKPTVGSHGDNVWTNIKSTRDLKEIISTFKDKGIHNGYFLIERQFKGNEYRVFITKNDFIATVQRIPANVIGDGKNTLLSLIQKENYRRMNPRTTCLCEIRLDDIAFDYMEKHNLTLDDVPKKGERVFLRGNSNVSTGGNCYDVTNTIHPSIKKLAKKILNIFTNLPYIGFDLICRDITQKLIKDSYIVCELNSAPGLSLHMLPEKGKPRNVAGVLVNLLFPETKKCYQNRN
jgi:D-alanine-D-alanine ligase-like ATP-grasp enzyme